MQREAVPWPIGQWLAAVLDEDDFQLPILPKYIQIFINILIILSIHLSFLLDFGLRDWEVKLKVYKEGGSFLNARKWSFYNAVFRSFFNAPEVISQRARAVTSRLHFVRAAAPFILQRAMVLTFCSRGFLVSRFLGFSVSWFLGFWVSWFLFFFLFSGSLGFSVSWFLCFLVSASLGFWVSWFLGLLVSSFLVFLFSEFFVWVLNVSP